MPSALKKWMLKEFTEQFRECEHLLFVGYQGITAEGSAELRNQLAKVGADMQVVKNTIAKLVLEELGKGNAVGFLDGPVAIVSGGDAAAAAKVLTTFSDGILPVKGGVLGAKCLSVGDTKALSELPSREVLLAQMAGALKAPLTKCVSLLQAPVRELRNCLGALKEKAGQ